MDIGGIIIFLIVGILAGWIAGLIAKGHGFGLLGNMAVGVIGAFLGQFLFQRFNIIATGFLGMLIAAIVGAVVLLVIIGLVRKLA